MLIFYWQILLLAVARLFEILAIDKLFRELEILTIYIWLNAILAIPVVHLTATHLSSILTQI